MTADGVLPQVQVAQVDGVPVYWCVAPGPLTAALVFRVGLADEGLPQSGLTHIVEHLALSGFGRQGFDYNGSVEETLTTFYAAGTEEQVVWFLRSVCDALRQLPLARLEPERRILQTEEAGRERSVYNHLAIWRFGATGQGLASFPPYALRGADAGTVQGWANTYFTQGNAVVWLSGPPPAGLRLPLLPGSWQQVRHAAAATFPLPARIPGPRGGVALTMLLPSVRPTGAVESVLQGRLFQYLRVEKAVSYDVKASRRHVDADSLLLYCGVDGLPDAQAVVEEGVLAVLDGMASVPPSAAEIEAWRGRGIRSLSEPTAVRALLNLMATQHLRGRAPEQPAALAAAFREYSPEEAHEQFRAGLQTMLVAVPENSAAWGPRLPLAPALPTWPAVSGRVFRDVDPSSVTTLTVGTAGVQLATSRQRLTIPWQQCAGVVHYADGGRQLVAFDGTALDVDPRQWRKYPEAVAELDRLTPAPLRMVGDPAPSRPPRPVPSSKHLGGIGTGAMAVLVVAILATGLLIAAVDSVAARVAAAAFVLTAVPMIVELYYRGRKKRRFRRPASTDAGQLLASGRLPTPVLALGAVVGVLGIALALSAAGSGRVGPVLVPLLIAGVCSRALGLRMRRRRNPQA